MPFGLSSALSFSSWEGGPPEKTQKFKFGNRHPLRFSLSFPLKSDVDSGAGWGVHWTEFPQVRLPSVWLLGQDGRLQNAFPGKMVGQRDETFLRWPPDLPVLPLGSASARGGLVPFRCINILDLRFWSRGKRTLDVFNSWAGRFQEEEKKLMLSVLLWNWGHKNWICLMLKLTFWIDILTVRDKDECLSFVPLFSICSPSPHLFFFFLEKALG